jgi:hypothetical protein
LGHRSHRALSAVLLAAAAAAGAVTADSPVSREAFAASAPTAPVGETADGGETLETAPTEDAPFAPFRSCDAYGRPNDGPGVTIVACDPDAVRREMDEGIDLPAIVWDGMSGDLQSRQPLMVTSATDDAPLVFHLQRDCPDLRIYAARTSADGFLQEGWFDSIVAPKGHRLTVDMSAQVWTVKNDAGRVVARYSGGAPFPDHHPLRLLKVLHEGQRLRAYYAFTAVRRHARMDIEVRRGGGWGVIATRPIPLGRSFGSVRFTPPPAARTARLVLHAGPRVEASRAFRLSR